MSPRELFTAAVIAVFLVGNAVAADPLKLTFDGRDYVHRWSKDGQNEFTLPSEPDLTTWHRMVTLNVHENVKTGDQLAQLANGVLGNYQRVGKILRTDSRPRTTDREAEHLIVAIVGAKGVIEATFARVRLVDGVGMITVYSQREYGDKAAAVIGEWLQKNGQAVEKALMTWDRTPSVAAIKALPQSK